jgi:multiple sugar transport system substrate-binding protein
MLKHRNHLRALALATTVLAGAFACHCCGAQDGGGLPEGEFGPFAPIAPGAVRLRVALWHTGLPGEYDLYQKILREFQDKTPDVHVVPGILDWDENTQQRMLRELRRETDSADIVLLRDTWLPELADELLSLDAALGGAARRGYPEAVLDSCRVDDALRGLPFCARTKCLFYRTGLMRTLHLKPPRTWAELPGVAQKLGTEPGVWGFGLPGAPSPDSAEILLLMLWAQGGELVDDEGQLVVGRELLEAVQLCNDLANVADATQFMPVTWPQRELEDLFLSGQLGMLIAEPSLEPRAAMRKPKLDYAVAPLPQWETRATRLSVDCLAISARSERPELALQFLRHASQDRYARDLCRLGLLSARKPQAADAKPPHAVGFGTFLDSLSHARPVPAQLWPDIWPYLANVLWETLTGRKAPEGALRDLLPPDVPSIMRLDGPEAEPEAKLEQKPDEPGTEEP